MNRLALKKYIPLDLTKLEVALMKQISR